MSNTRWGRFGTPPWVGLASGGGGGGGGGAGSLVGTSGWIGARAWWPVETFEPNFIATRFATNNIQTYGWGFPDSGDKRLQVYFTLPQNWVVAPGTLTLRLHSYHPSGSTGGTVRVAVRSRCYPDGQNIDQALGTAVNVDDSPPALNQIMISALSGAVTPAGTLTLNAGILLDIRRDNSVGGNSSGEHIFLGASLYWNP